MIKEIREDEIAECVDVVRKSFYTVAEEFGFTADNAPRFTAFATTQDRLFYQLKNEHRQMYAYYDEHDRIIGYYSLKLLDDSQCELNNLCVLPQYRHRQIGTALLEDACAKAQKAGCPKIKLGIVEENEVLKKWYTKNGFVHTGTKKFDFFPFTCGYMEMKFVHDGISPIHVPEGDEDEAFQVLWDYLVPPQGKAQTAQGEVIRIAGRVQQEFLGNGCVNWDEDYLR